MLLTVGEIIKLFIYGLVEGISEWLPISSTGHLLILEEFLPLGMSRGFTSLFRIVIQLAAIIAVIIYFWRDIFPLKRASSRESPGKTKGFYLDGDIMQLWFRIIVACIPAGIVGVFLDDFFEKYFYNPLSVAIALILVAILFLLVEHQLQGRVAHFSKLEDISYKAAFFIGIFQMLAGVFPGVSRSGACILAGLLLGFSRPLASTFSFYLAIPVMFGASFLKLLKLKESPLPNEVFALLFACLVAFVTSMLTIRFFLNYVKKHSFRLFAVYRILLGFLLLILFMG